LTVLMWTTAVVVVLVALAAAALVVPRRVDRFQREFALLVIQPARDLVGACRRFIQAFTANARTVLALGGIAQHHVSQSVGALVAFVAGAISLVGELDLAVLALAALGLGPAEESVTAGLGLSPPDAMAFTLAGSAALWGILALDLVGITSSLPVAIPQSAAARCVLMVLAVGVVIGCCSCGAMLAMFRHDALMTDATSVPGIGSTAHLRIVFAFLGVITTLTSIVAVAMLPAALAVLVVILLMIGLIPAGVITALGWLAERLVTVVFNLIVSALAVLTGLLGAIGGRSDDSVDQAPPASVAAAAVPPAVAANPPSAAEPDGATPPPAAGPDQPPAGAPYDPISFDPFA